MGFDAETGDGSDVIAVDLAQGDRRRALDCGKCCVGGGQFLVEPQNCTLLGEAAGSVCRSRRVVVSMGVRSEFCGLVDTRPLLGYPKQCGANARASVLRIHPLALEIADRRGDAPVCSRAHRHFGKADNALR